jgi:hypothetical protein
MGRLVGAGTGTDLLPLAWQWSVVLRLCCGEGWFWRPEDGGGDLGAADVLRPPIAQERLELRPDGLVRIILKRAYADGTVAIVFSADGSGRS